MPGKKEGFASSGDHDKISLSISESKSSTKKQPLTAIGKTWKYSIHQLIEIQQLNSHNLQSKISR